jgi:hypothetical protein
MHIIRFNDLIGFGVDWMDFLTRGNNENAWMDRQVGR